MTAFKILPILSSVVVISFSTLCYAADEQAADEAYSSAYNMCSARADQSVEVPFEVVFSRCMSDQGITQEEINQSMNQLDEAKDAEY
ncbi:MAG: hypothetical protein IPP74_00105 [Alphaproteobacteria bacterium]|nr:hypothetical protein [Alphaproteobacteria bacterium]